MSFANYPPTSRPPFEVRLQPARASIQPGEALQTQLLVYNTGASSDTYAVTVLGADPAWVFIGQLEGVNLAGRNLPPVGPGRQIELPIFVTPTPDSRAGLYRLGVRVVRTNDPQQTDGRPAERITDLELTIVSLPAFRLDLNPRVIDMGRRNGAVVQVGLTNVGNTDLTLALDAGDPSETLLYDLLPQVNVPAGQEVVLPLRIRPDRPTLVGTSAAYDFTITATPIRGTLPPPGSGLPLPSIGAARTAVGRANYTPPIPVWLASLGFLAALIVTLCVGALVITNANQNHTIAQNTIAAATATAGNTLADQTNTARASQLDATLTAAVNLNSATQTAIANNVFQSQTQIANIAQATATSDASTAVAQTQIALAIVNATVTAKAQATANSIATANAGQTAAAQTAAIQTQTASINVGATQTAGAIAQGTASANQTANAGGTANASGSATAALNFGATATAITRATQTAAAAVPPTSLPAGQPQILNQGLNAVAALGIASDGRQVYVAQGSGGQAGLYSVSGTGTDAPAPVFTGVGVVEAFVPAQGGFFFLTGNKFAFFDAGSKQQTVIFDGLSRPRLLSLLNDTSALIYEAGNNKIVTITFDAAKRATGRSEGLTVANVTGIAVANNVLYLTQSNGALSGVVLTDTPAVVRPITLTPANGRTDSTLSRPAAIVASTGENGVLYVAEGGASRITRITFGADGAFRAAQVETFANLPNSDQPVDLSLSADGSTLYVASNTRLYRITTR